MARTGSFVSVSVEGNLGPLDQMTTGAIEPLTIAVVDASGNQITSFGGVTASTTLSGLQVNLMELKGVTLDTNSGTKSEGSQRIVIATDDVNMSAIKTSVEILDNAISGSEMQVDIVAAIPAGSNNIGDVDIASFAAGASVSLAGLEVSGIAKDFDGTTPGFVPTEGDTAGFITDRNRRLYVNTVHPQLWSYHTDRVAGLVDITDKSIQAAPAANNAVFVTDIAISSSAVTGGLAVFFEEGSTKILGPYFLEAGIAGRGAMISFQTPKKLTSATALTLSTLQEGGGRVEYSIDVHGYLARVN